MTRSVCLASLVLATAFASLAFLPTARADDFSHSPIPKQHLRPVVRFVDRYQTAGSVSTFSVPSAVIGAVRRAVLAGPEQRSLLVEPLSPGSGPEVTVKLDVPKDLHGLPLLFHANTSGRDLNVVNLNPPFTESARARETLRLRLSGRVDKSGAELTVAALRPPELRYLTQPLRIQPGARLRFAIGVEDESVVPRPPRTSFKVTAVFPSGDRVLFNEQVDPATTDLGHWHDREIDLGSLAGKDLRLRFRTKQEKANSPFAFPLWADPTIVVPAPEEDEAQASPWNVLLISLDTLRADHLSVYGYGRATSPTIDSQVAARGTLFEHAYSAYPATPASHMTILTGLLPCVHGTTGLSRDQKLPADLVTLAEILRAAGYETAAFTEDGWVTADLGFARGFDTFVENTSPKLNEPLGQAEKTFGEALDWIRTHRDQAWFVFAHTYQVHHPYVPPPGYLDMVASDHSPDRDATSAALYDGEIRYTDDLLARLLAGLDASGVGGRTLIILLSDHGEHFGEHGRYLHGFDLYDELLHVPLIFRAPGLVAAGKRIGENAGLIDVAPTVVDLLGLPPMVGSQGRSLAPILRGESLAPATLYAELSIFKQIAARTGSTKQIVNLETGAGQVFDTAVDPGEQHDLVAQGSARVEWGKIDEFKRLCAPRAPAQKAGSGDRLDPAVREKLKALGYVY
jgi:arylsulfatase A-like enzyme